MSDTTPAPEPRATAPADPTTRPPDADPRGACAASADDPRGDPPPDEPPPGPPRLQHPARGRRCVRKDSAAASPLSPQQRLLLLDAWRRSGLPAGDFAPLVGVSKHTLYAWHRKFQLEGPA